jgi:hypothetical protein
MSELTKNMDLILFEIDEKRWLSLSKDSPKELFKAKDKLRAFKLIERQNKYSWKLTRIGYEAVELGGFEQWFARNQTDNNKATEQNFNGENITFNSGDSKTAKNTESTNGKAESVLKLIVVPVAVTIIGGIALFFITEFIKDDTEKTITDKSKTQPISIVFQSGEKADLSYSINFSLIDSLILKTANRFGSEDQAIDYIYLKARNQIISTLESVDIETARIKRDSLSKSIITQTINEQIYSGYRISTLNLDEIRTLANNLYKK